MTAHQLARLLLDGPDIDVAVMGNLLTDNPTIRHGVLIDQTGGLPPLYTSTDEQADCPGWIRERLNARYPAMTVVDIR